MGEKLPKNVYSICTIQSVHETHNSWRELGEQAGYSQRKTLMTGLLPHLHMGLHRTAPNASALHRTQTSCDLFKAHWPLFPHPEALCWQVTGSSWQHGGGTYLTTASQALSTVGNNNDCSAYGIQEREEGKKIPVQRKRKKIPWIFKGYCPNRQMRRDRLTVSTTNYNRAQTDPHWLSARINPKAYSHQLPVWCNKWATGSIGFFICLWALRHMKLLTVPSLQWAPNEIINLAQAPYESIWFI